MGLSKTIWTNPTEFLKQQQPENPVLFFAPSAVQAVARRFLTGFPGLVTYAAKSNPGEEMVENLVAAGIKGVIINLSSSSVRGAPLGVHYTATKAGIIGMTRSMALSLASKGIRVNAIAPGLTDTAQPRYGNSEAELAVMAQQIPLGRMGRPEEIAGLMVYLASDQAAWITGQVYHINGGNYLA